MKTMQARFPGRCAKTGAPIRPGDLIIYAGKGRSYLSDLLPAVDPDLALAGSIDPELANIDPDAAAHAGRYLRQSIARGVSDIWTSNGREFYRNRRGLCEDAPCCGCCNA